MDIKLFRTLIIVIPCLIVLILCLFAIPKKENFIYDEAGDIEAFDSLGVVTNSQMGFFYKRDQLSTYRKQQKPDKVKTVKIAENIVTTDFTKADMTVLPDINTSYTGSRNVLLHEGEVKEFTGYKDKVYTLKGGAQVPEEDTFSILLSHGVLGHSNATPYRITKGNIYHTAFTEKLESVYFEFETSNEFLSVVLGGLSGRVEYELYDSSMNSILTDWNHSKESIEIQYKGRDAAKYYLRVTGSFEKQLQPFSVKLSSDDNEWMWQMAYPKKDTEVTGRFDYYGDDDYYVLPKKITEQINKSVMRFTAASHDINVVIYDKDRKMLGQYVYDAQNPEPISMYGLEGAYAMSIYSYSGQNSGTEYKFILEHTPITVLDIESYGFELMPGFNEQNDYYTAYVDSVADKKITDVMYSPKEATVSIKVTQQCGYTSTAKLGDTLDLAPGRNTVELSVTINNSPRTITIVIADKTSICYGKTTKEVQDQTQGIKVAKGQKVLVTAKEDGKYKIQIMSGSNIGKMMTVSKSAVYIGYEQVAMPSAYAEKINALKAKHPGWKFEFVDMGVSFDSYVNSQIGANSTLDNTGKPATREQIAAAVNPLNFLDEKNIFMFEDASYNTNIEYKDSGIKAIWNDETTAYNAMRAAEVSGISPYFITARAALESGRGTSKLSRGEVNGYKGYYNFFGIGAYDIDPLNGGAAKAKQMNWDSKRKALIGGALWMDANYVSYAQQTIYFFKFNPYASNHQYMSDIYAPKKDAEQLYKANVAAGTLGAEHTFIIPVYK